MSDKDRAAALFSETLAALALSPEKTSDPELARTPERFTELLAELTDGLREAPPKLSAFPASDSSKDTVLVCALPFHSMCVHHLVPFFGTIDVAYIPGENIIGFGSIGRVVEHFAKRPQVQERLVREVGEYLEEHLEPEGLIVRCRARQMCMELRGVRKRAILVSSYSSGQLERGPERDEILRQFLAAEVEP